MIGRRGGEKRNEREKETGMTRKKERTEIFLDCRIHIKRGNKEQGS